MNRIKIRNYEIRFQHLNVIKAIYESKTDNTDNKQITMVWVIIKWPLDKFDKVWWIISIGYIIYIYILYIQRILLANIGKNSVWIEV